MSKEVIEEGTEFVQDGESCDTVSTPYAEMYEEQKAKVEELEKELVEAKRKIAELEEGINTKQKDFEQMVNDYKQLQSRYDRLFLLYANNLDFYLANKGNE